MNPVHSFDALAMGDLVRWHPKLQDRWRKLPNADDFWAEPFKCVMSVNFIVKAGEDWERGLELVCVRDCGCHDVTIMSAADFDDWSYQLGEPVLVWSGMHELGEFLLDTSDPKPEYSFEQDELSISALVERGDLPQKRQRG